MMRWASAVSDRRVLAEAADACAAEVIERLEGAEPDLAVVFVSPHFAAAYEEVGGLLRERLGAPLLLGCSASGVIGAGHEVEERPGLSITAAQLPGVRMTPFAISTDQLPNLDMGPDQWERLTGVPATPVPHFVLLADPFSMQMEDALAGLDFAYPASTKIGGLASGAQRPGGNVLYLGEQVRRSGLVGVAFTGDIVIDTVVAQGCRPIGAPMRITKCERNLLLEMDGRSPLQVLQELYERAPEKDRALFNRSLFLGIVMDELQDEYRLGDFLIRNLYGIDRDRGGLLVGAPLREHQTVQFHLRDAETAGDDLRSMLSQYLAEHDPARAQGALLFSCVGRGSYLYGRPDHDTGIFSEYLGPVPLGGFFCNGEIGQVGGATYLHGYTSSFGIFRSK